MTTTTRNTWAAWQAERSRAALLLAWLKALPGGTKPAIEGPLCEPWHDNYPDCVHDSCYRIAYRDAPAHACAVEADHDDPMSRSVGMYLATCEVCQLWQTITY
jgi:hypothetical protein